MLPHIFQLIVFSDVNSPTKLLFAYQEVFLSNNIHIQQQKFPPDIKKQKFLPDRNCVITKKNELGVKDFL